MHFKIKDLPTTDVYVKFASGGGPETELSFALATVGSTIPNTDGWYDVTIPLSNFVDQTSYTEFAIMGGWSNGGTFLVTDIYIN